MPRRYPSSQARNRIRRNLTGWSVTPIAHVGQSARGIYRSTCRATRRWFRVTDDGTAQREERAARIAISHAAIRLLCTRMDYQEQSEDYESTLRLIRECERQVQYITEGKDAGAHVATARVDAERTLRLHGVAAERSDLRALQQSGKINEQVLFTLRRELDDQEASLRIRASAAEHE